MNSPREFPGGLVVRIPGFHCHDPGSIPGQGTEIPKAASHGQKKKRMSSSRCLVVVNVAGHTPRACAAGRTRTLVGGCVRDGIRRMAAGLPALLSRETFRPEALHALREEKDENCPLLLLWVPLAVSLFRQQRGLFTWLCTTPRTPPRFKEGQEGSSQAWT